MVVDLASCKATEILNQKNVVLVKDGKCSQDDPPSVVGWVKDSSIVIFFSPFGVGNDGDFDIYDLLEKQCFGYCSAGAKNKKSSNIKKHDTEIHKIMGGRKI